MHKGIHTASSKALYRKLACIGVPAERIAEIMGLCADSYGIQLIGKPSARSVGRAVLEGYVAAQIQLGSEVYNVGFTQLSHLAWTAQHTSIQFVSPNTWLSEPPTMPMRRVKLPSVPRYE